MARPSSSSPSPWASSERVNSTTVRRSVSYANLDDPRGDFSFSEISSPHTSETLPTHESLYPDGKRSLSSIGFQAFYIGFGFAASLILGIQAAVYGYGLWRLCAFLGCLTLFHFLEYWTTAAYNTANVRASSFLLFSNGTAYNLAHSCAAAEILVSHFLFPQYQHYLCNKFTVSLGLFLVVLGQVTRSTAMATAGSSFNHIPQKVRRSDHVLVTSGVYSWSRHPSYFGFFWWAIGTQLLVGNKFCLIAYTLVLWRFFRKRIHDEEIDLVAFFGSDFEEFRDRTKTGIPFI